MCGALSSMAFSRRVAADAEPTRGARTGLHEMGLPYVNDPAITRHLASFLKRHLSGDGATISPNAILFNGGVFTPAVLRDRVVEVLHQWFDRHAKGLATAGAHESVARSGRRLGSRAFRLAQAHRRPPHRRRHRAVLLHRRAESDARRRETTVLCVVPQHLEEGQEISLSQPELELSLGQPVMFPLYTSTVRAGDKAGDLLEVAPTQLLQMPPLHTVLRGGKRSGTKSVPVTLATRCTEIGTLELFCVAKDGHNRWRLEFNVRDIVRDADDTASPRKRRHRCLARRAGAGGGHADSRRLSDRRPTIPSSSPRNLKRPLMPGAINGQPGCAGGCGNSWPRSPISAACRPPICRAGTTLPAFACGPDSAIRWTDSASSNCGSCCTSRRKAPSRAWPNRKAAPTSGSCGGASRGDCRPACKIRCTTDCGRSCCRARARRPSRRRTNTAKCGERRPAWNGST